MSEILDLNSTAGTTDITTMSNVFGMGKDGAVKKINASYLGRVFLAEEFETKAQWIRVMKLNGSAAGMFSIYHAWNTNRPCPILLAFSFKSSQNDAALDTLVRNIIGETGSFSKARIVYPAQKSGAIKECYLEVYKKVTDAKVRLESGLFQFATPCLEEGAIPEGYTSKEISLSAVIGE